MLRFPCICIFNPYGMINISKYMIMLYGSTCIDGYIQIYVHVVPFVFLGKRWCQRVTKNISILTRFWWSQNVPSPPLQNPRVEAPRPALTVAFFRKGGGIATLGGLSHLVSCLVFAITY